MDLVGPDHMSSALGLSIFVAGIAMLPSAPIAGIAQKFLPSICQCGPVGTTPALEVGTQRTWVQPQVQPDT